MRKLKEIGLSAIAVLAVSAVSASGASAAEEGTTIVTGGATAGFTATQTGGGHTFTLPGGRTLSCSTATFAGTATGGATTVEATPTYTGCHATIGVTTLPATVEVTGCNYKFYHLTTAAPLGTDTWAATTDVVCPAGQSIHIKLFSNAANHAAGTRLCEYTVDPQGPLTGVHFTDTTAINRIDIDAKEVSVQLTRTFGIEATCGPPTSTSKYNGNTLSTPQAGREIHIDHH